MKSPSDIVEDMPQYDRDRLILMAINSLESLKEERDQLLTELNNAIRNAVLAQPQQETEPSDMAKKKKTKVKHATVVRRGKEIIIPEGMSPGDAITWLHRKQEEEEAVVGIHEPISGYLFDALHAFSVAMTEEYGWNNMVPTPGFWGPTPPKQLSIQTADGPIQVPWGRMNLPGIDGFVSTTYEYHKGQVRLLVGGEVKRKHEKAVHNLCKVTRKLLRKKSLYKGQAIRVYFPNVEEGESPFDGTQPEFMDLSTVKKSDLIFPKETQQMVTSSLFTPVKHTEACREAGIPLKRGVLLEGPFGVGKTLTANITAKLCVENGWTFIYLTRPHDLARAIEAARQYEPAVIFTEDIDRLVAERDHEANELLNTIDGIDSKDRELIVVLTSNNVEDIHPAMLRPGRLDAVIPVRPPDAEAAERLIRLYGRGLIGKDEDLAAAGASLAGRIPAVIREAVERSKLAAIARQKGRGELVLKGQDLVEAAEGMIAHLELIRPRPKDDRSGVEKAADILGQRLTDSFGPTSPVPVTNGTHHKRA